MNIIEQTIAALEKLRNAVGHEDNIAVADKALADLKAHQQAVEGVGLPEPYDVHYVRENGVAAIQTKGKNDSPHLASTDPEAHQQAITDHAAELDTAYAITVMGMVEDYAKAVHDGDDAACKVLHQTIKASLEQPPASKPPQANERDCTRCPQAAVTPGCCGGWPKAPTQAEAPSEMEAFERLFHRFDLRPSVTRVGHYNDLRVEFMWEAWQARAALAAPVQPEAVAQQEREHCAQICDSIAKEYIGGFGAPAERCAKAIRATRTRAPKGGGK